MTNPYFDKGAWYWYDETGDVYGPYDLEEEAKTMLTLYCKSELEGILLTENEIATVNTIRTKYHGK